MDTSSIPPSVILFIAACILFGLGLLAAMVRLRGVTLLCIVLGFIALVLASFSAQSDFEEWLNKVLPL